MSKAPLLPCPPGWKLVPEEPTEEMVARAFDIHPCRPGEAKVSDSYRAMLAAAPDPPASPSPAPAGDEELVERAAKAIWSNFCPGMEWGDLDRRHCLSGARAILSAIAPAIEARAYERAARIARDGCLVPPDGGSPTEDEWMMCESIAASIRALATKGGGE